MIASSVAQGMASQVRNVEQWSTMDEKKKINHEDLLAEAFHDHVKQPPVTETTGFDLSGLIRTEGSDHVVSGTPSNGGHPFSW